MLAFRQMRLVVMKFRFIEINLFRVFAVVLFSATTMAQSVVQRGDILALTNITVIDGNGGRPKGNTTLIITCGHIADVFPSGKKPLPPGATVMNLRGQYVMPGLIDSHYHLL